MLRSIRALMALFLVMFAAAPAQAASLKVDMKRLIRVEGVVDEKILDAGADLLALTEKSKEPVYVLINSAGGDVLFGMQFANAIKTAQSRGVAVKCFVPNLAMSMAFFIFTQCNERYALKYSLLLFHPARVTLMGAYRADELTVAAEALTQIEEPLINEMIQRTNLPRPFFLKHYRAETIWTGDMFNKQNRAFLRIVDDFGAASSLTLTTADEP